MLKCSCILKLNFYLFFSFSKLLALNSNCNEYLTVGDNGSRRVETVIRCDNNNNNTANNNTDKNNNTDSNNNGFSQKNILWNLNSTSDDNSIATIAESTKHELLYGAAGSHQVI